MNSSFYQYINCLPFRNTRLLVVLVFSFMCMLCRSFFVLLYFFFLSLCCLFLIRFTASDYPFGIFKLSVRNTLPCYASSMDQNHPLYVSYLNHTRTPLNSRQQPRQTAQDHNDHCRNRTISYGYCCIGPRLIFIKPTLKLTCITWLKVCLHVLFGYLYCNMSKLI